jgi:hypothetical protein
MYELRTRQYTDFAPIFSPYTVLPGNTTWFSGNVYVSLNHINAECNWSGTNVEVGSTHGGEILTLAPSELYSQRATPTIWNGQTGFIDFGNEAYSFNFGDLVSPYPWSAWAGLDYCVMSKCSTMSGAYNPRIAVPEAIRRMDPRWATCDLALYGLYDPPIALRSVGFLSATPTQTPSGLEPTPGQSAPLQIEPTNTPIVPGAPLPWQSTSALPIPPVQPPVIPQPSPVPVNTPAPEKPNDPTWPPPSDPSQPDDPNSRPPSPNNPNPGSPSRVPGQNDPNTPRPGLTPAPVTPQPTTIGTIGAIPIVVNPTNPAQVVIGSNTLTPNAPALTIGGGTTISMQDPSHIIIATPGAAAPSTINVPQPIGQGVPTPSAGVVLTMLNGEHITATAIIGEGHNGEKTATTIIVSGTMFSAGGPPITLANGVVLSEAPSGSGVVVIDPKNSATSTIAFSSIPGIYHPGTTPAPTAIVTIGGHAYTATSQGGSVVIPELGITISQGGPAITVNGTAISNAGGTTGVVVGSSTATFPSVAATPTASGGRGGTVATGVAVRSLKNELWVMWWSGFVCLSSVLFLL